MAKQKEVKTNAMRILDKLKIDYTHQSYSCNEFVDGLQTADLLNLPYEQVYKTLVTEGKSKNYFVFVIPIEKELDMKKAAKAVGEVPLQAELEFVGEGDFDNAGFDEDLEGGDIELADGVFDAAVFAARGVDEEGVVVFVGDDADVFADADRACGILRAVARAAGGSACAATKTGVAACAGVTAACAAVGAA